MDAIFKALNDPARRTLLDSLRHKDGQSLQELERQLQMTRFGVMKHLKVLEDAHLVTTRKVGRFKYHYLNAVPLQEVIDRWIEPLLAKPTARAVIDLKSSLEGTAQMTTSSEKPDFVSETFIKTSLDALWDALTKADLMEQYHFACQNVEGDAVEGQTTNFILPDGGKMLSQSTISLTPKSRLEMTFVPHFFGPDAPSSRVVYSAEAQGPLCKLTCEHFGIPAGQEGVAEGWARWTSSLKSFLETGQGLQMAMEEA
ncbi:ArsR/SmtB family transcription factor [Algirhabdus cladophorae]|uniref:ArsR/SmtB family transcription factor n=1 Tax=Algirhabdus cladophorae TaxID=3377108 RepID=UPI003B847185